MFGMGFLEILLVAIIAIIALGPDKLPGAMVDIARFLKKFKSGVEDAKSTLDNELNISEMKAEASKFKAQIEETKSSLSVPDLDLGINDIMKDDLNTDLSNDTDSLDAPVETKEKKEKVSFKKKKKEPKEETKVSKTDKFKVKQDGDDA